MTYAIAHIVLGVDFTHSPYSSKPDPFADFRDEIYRHMEGEYDDTKSVHFQQVSGPTPGFESRYSGGGEQPQWFGIHMGEFDECENMLASKLITKLTVTDEHRQAYAKLLDELRANDNVSDELKAAIEKTEPVVFLAWGSS